MVYFPTEQDWMLTTRPDRISLEERFPKHLVVINLPASNRKDPKSAAHTPAGTVAGASTAPRAQMRRNPEQQVESSNEQVRSFMNRTGSNLVPLGKNREVGELSEHTDRETLGDQSDTSFIDRALDFDESLHDLPSKWS